METKFFADIIKEVLFRSDLACLPGLGSFVTEEVPASFSDKGFTINPPYLKPVFDTSVTNDYGLVDFYAVNNGVSRTVAMNAVASQVDLLRRELTASRTVLLPDLGYLRLTMDGNIFFVPCEGLDMFPQYDLLQSVSLRYIPAGYGQVAAAEVPTSVPVASAEESPEVALEVAPAEEAPAEPASQGPKSAKRRVLPYVFLTLCILAVLFFAALYVLGHYFPQIVDPLLYNADELEVIKQMRL